MKTLPKVITIVGPTGSGKSLLALALAKKFNGAIINADSRQIYKGFEIGTDAPVFERRGGAVGYIENVPHYLYGAVSPRIAVSASDFAALARRAMARVRRQGLLPILVGGTGFYTAAALGEIALTGVPPDLKLRARLERRLKRHGLAALVTHLYALDPTARGRVDEKNPRRVLRAIEIAASGVTVSKKLPVSPYAVLKIGVRVTRAQLYKKVNRRIDEMVTHGLEKEVQQLAKHYGWNVLPMTGIGYKQWRKFFENGHGSRTNIIQRIKFDTHAYIRRQMTWFRKENNVKWVRDVLAAQRLVKAFVKK